jgi:hypothetical protein
LANEQIRKKFHEKLSVSSYGASEKVSSSELFLETRDGQQRWSIQQLLKTHVNGERPIPGWKESADPK